MITMSKLNCRQVTKVLGEARPADWSTETRAALDEHLASCEACRREAAALDLVSSVLSRRRATTHAPDGFASSVMSRVASREVARSRSWFLSAFNVRSMRPALAAAVLVVVMMTAAAVYVHRSPAGDDTVAVAEASQSFVDELVLSHQDLSTDTGADAGILLTRYAPACP
jgi:predicted anti-sigma-YlaC factor YlaD